MMKKHQNLLHIKSLIYFSKLIDIMNIIPMKYIFYVKLEIQKCNSGVQWIIKLYCGYIKFKVWIDSNKKDSKVHCVSFRIRNSRFLGGLAWGMPHRATQRSSLLVETSMIAAPHLEHFCPRSTPHVSQARLFIQWSNLAIIESANKWFVKNFEDWDFGMSWSEIFLFLIIFKTFDYL